MSADTLENTLFTEICKIPLIDPHSHINPLQPTSKTLDDILGYHYYTELAHSAGMSKDCLADDFNPKERVRTILSYMERFENTVQYSWFLEIAQTFLGFEGDRITAQDCDTLLAAAEEQFSRPDWEDHVLKTTNVEKIFLTNDFDDPLEGFDTEKYVPCLRVDELVFKNDVKSVRKRVNLAASGTESTDRFKKSQLRSIFEKFARKGVKACAVSLPPNFIDADGFRGDEGKVFHAICECCQACELPFDLMIGVFRDVYTKGVFQGQDLFDQRVSLFDFEEIFNQFGQVTFPVSVLSSGQNQELCSYSWIFPNVVTSGHWWYSNVPAFIEKDLRARLQAVPQTKQIGYYSDAYKLEFILPKFNMYRRILARVLAQDFVRDRGWSEERAVALAKTILRDNVERIFKV